MTNKKIKNFEDFEIWKRAAEIAIDIYKISDSGNLKNDLKNHKRAVGYFKTAIKFY